MQELEVFHLLLVKNNLAYNFNSPFAFTIFVLRKLTLCKNYNFFFASNMLFWL